MLFLTKVALITNLIWGALQLRGVLVTTTDGNYSEINLTLTEDFQDPQTRIQYMNYLNPIINGSSFDSMRSSQGGSIYLVDPIINHYINNTIFKNSSSTSQGGSIYSSSKNPITFFNDWFEKSISNNYGGAIYINELSANTYIIENCYFGFCNSTNGGAIYIQTILNSEHRIMDCSFYKCHSINDGGAISIMSTTNNQFSCNFERVCCSECTIGTASKDGSAINIVTSNNKQITMKILSIAYCGRLSFAKSSLRIDEGLQYGEGINFSYNMANSYAICYLKMYSSSNYKFCTATNCSSTNCMYLIASISSILLDIDKWNFICNGQIGGNLLYAFGFIMNQIVFKYCIFQNNLGSFITVNNGNPQRFISCYLVHGEGAIGSLTLDSCISTNELTETHSLTHYSTYLCNTPFSMGGLEIPCQTIPENYESHSECQTLLPIQSTCIVKSCDELKMLQISSMFNLIGFVAVLN